MPAFRAFPAIRFGNGDVRHLDAPRGASRFDERARAVARAVIDDDRFEGRRVPLRLERIERTGEKVRAIARRDDDGEPHYVPSASSDRAIRSAAPACAP